MTNILTPKADKVFLVRDNHNGEDVWFYILVDAVKLPIFRKKIGRESIDLQGYGKILYSGYGKNPPEDIKKKLHQEFDVEYIG
jgi:hypothetical protein